MANDDIRGGEGSRGGSAQEDTFADGGARPVTTEVFFFKKWKLSRRVLAMGSVLPDSLLTAG